MPRIINLKYAAVCKDCGATLEVGDRARYYGRGKIYGVDCHDRPSDESLAADRAEAREAQRERQRDDHEYAMGQMEGRRYLDDVKTYGRDLAEQWEMEAEMGRYNRGEE